MSLETWFAFVLLWLAVAAAPGPNAAFTVATTLARGLPQAFWVPLGIALSMFVHAIISAAGLGALLLASAQLFTLLKWLGVAYLVWLGLQAWRRGTAIRFEINDKEKGRRGLVMQALMVSLANPKAVLAFVAIYPQFIQIDQAVIPQLALLTVTSAGVALLVYGAYAALAGRLRVWFSGPSREGLVHRLVGSVYLLGAAGLALAVRK